MAELLITIGIIGVVAALTIPMLANNANSKKFASQYKKTLSSLAQASLMSQARYYIDYSNLSVDSSDESCASDALSSGNNSMCGLFNNVFSAKSYKGTYGNVSGILPLSKYKIKTTSQGFNPDGFMIYSLSDGAIVGFNPNAKGCSLEEGTRVNNEVLTGSLANCVGFIDVNGVSLPNREVTCDTSSETSLSPNTACSVQKANGDVFPVVFHNGTVEPATNAARAILNAARSAGESDGGDSSSAAPTRQKITYNGQEYELYSEFNGGRGAYFYEDEDGNLICSDGKIYTRQPDGKYKNDDNYYDENMNKLLYENNEWYYKKCAGSTCYFIKNADNGDYIGSTGAIYTKQPDGTYLRGDFVYDKDFNIIAKYKDGILYPRTSDGILVIPDGHGNYRSEYGSTFTKRDDGTYVFLNAIEQYVYDKDFIVIGVNSNGKFYERKSVDGSQRYVYKDDDGNYTSVYQSSAPIIKREDGFYEWGNYLYDDELRRIGTK